VRADLSAALHNLSDADARVAALAEIAKRFDGKDRAYLESLGLGAKGVESAVYLAAKTAMAAGSPDTWNDAFAWIAWRLHPAEAVSDFKARALNDKLTPDQRKLMLTAIAFAPGREAAGAMLELAHTKGFPMQDLAKWWLMNRKGNDWKAYDIDGSMKALGIYDPDKVKLVASPMPPAPVNVPTLDLAQIAALKGDAKNGALAVGACYTCHHIGNAGVDFGPDLTTYGKQQTTDILIQAIAQPSHTISHGYEGSEIKTTDGLVITGMVLSDSDPLIIKCMGGVVQTIPQSRIASRSKLKTSLMYEPNMLGLTPQGIADIVAYLKGL
jgi:putative heme-binding domain-containing protein